MENKILEIVITTLKDKLVKDINVIDFQKENPFTDYFVVCQANNQRQIDAIVNGLVQLNKKETISIRDIDGKSNTGWVAIDLYDVVVHVFDKATREHYQLEKLFYKYPQRQISDDVQ